MEEGNLGESRGTKEGRFLGSGTIRRRRPVMCLWNGRTQEGEKAEKIEEERSRGRGNGRKEKCGLLTG